MRPDPSQKALLKQKSKEKSTKKAKRNADNDQEFDDNPQPQPNEGVPVVDTDNKPSSQQNQVKSNQATE